MDVSTDPQNCGDCGQRCASTATCVGGACKCPTAGQTSCPNGCFDLQSDESNCGVCGNNCPSSISCTAGVCDCGNGLVGCFGSCTDLTTSQSSCGKCGNSCPYGATCTNSKCMCSDSSLTACGTQCVDTDTDATNCGKCGSRCSSSQICTAGACTSCAGTSLPSSGTVSYAGKATASTKRPGYCGSSMDGVALAWAPPAGTYSVTLSSAGNVAADVYMSCSASNAQYCLSKTSASVVSVPSGGSVIFFVRDADGASSAYTLTTKPVDGPPVL